VHEALRSGLELPALTLAAGRDRRADESLVATLQRVAAQAAAAGFGALWFAEGPAVPREDEVWGDPCVLAAACAATGSPIHLGVVAGDGGGRHPSAVARDVTALDHVSGGRAALRLDYPGRAADAARVCRGLFTETVTTVDGRVYRTDRAVNRPPPVQRAGPPLVAAVGAAEVDDELVAAVDALCADGDTAEVARVRAAASETAVLWAGTLPLDGGEAVAQVARLREAGADGIVCRVADLATLTADAIGAWADATNGSAP
jgi:alkanesulfonate monooxygenase SsuD/methylene tetrahydromethanopterin reductase-like flavin-dependent oxidoreductase (luciferase family)